MPALRDDVGEGHHLGDDIVHQSGEEGKIVLIDLPRVHEYAWFSLGRFAVGWR
jgi:hypothetical protein